MNSAIARSVTGVAGGVRPGVALCSIANHWRLVQVRVVCSLLEHEVCHIGPRELSAAVFAYVAYAVLPLLLSFVKHRCTYDHPLEVALLYYPRLSWAHTGRGVPNGSLLV